VAAARVSLEQELELLKTEQTTLHYALQASNFYTNRFPTNFPELAFTNSGRKQLCFTSHRGKNFPLAYSSYIIIRFSLEKLKNSLTLKNTS
jgi:hypothetical protein